MLDRSRGESFYAVHSLLETIKEIHAYKNSRLTIVSPAIFNHSSLHIDARRGIYSLHVVQSHSSAQAEIVHILFCLRVSGRKVTRRGFGINAHTEIFNNVLTAG